MILVGVMGPTASGKSDLAEQLADDLNAILINADAFQVYRGMDIGTAKPECRGRYHLLDIKEPDEGFGVGEFVSLANDLLHQSFREGKNAVVVGGTGLYVRALFEEYAAMSEAPDPMLRKELSQMSGENLAIRLMELAPDVAARIDILNPVRVQRAVERALSPQTSLPWHLPDYRKLKLAIIPDKSTTDARIARRAESMMHNGWVQEVRDLRDAGFKPDDPGFRAIGYQTLWRYLDEEVELEEATATAIAESIRYAKRQRTWLRSEPNLIQLNVDDALADARRQIDCEIRLGAKTNNGEVD